MLIAISTQVKRVNKSAGSLSALCFTTRAGRLAYGGDERERKLCSEGLAEALRCGVQDAPIGFAPVRKRWQLRLDHAVPKPYAPS